MCVIRITRTQELPSLLSSFFKHYDWNSQTWGEICGLNLYNPWTKSKHDISISFPCTWSLLDLVYTMDDNIVLISGHGLNLSHKLDVTHIHEFKPMLSNKEMKVHESLLEAKIKKRWLFKHSNYNQKIELCSYIALARIFSWLLASFKESTSPPRIRTCTGVRSITPRRHCISPDNKICEREGRRKKTCLVKKCRRVW